MEKLLKKRNKGKKFCCFNLSSSSGDESVITIDRDSILAFESVPQRKFALNNYAADKVYIISSAPQYIAICIKHIIITPKAHSQSHISQAKSFQRGSLKPSPSLLLKEEDSLIKSSEVQTDNFLSEKTIKKLCKLLNSRGTYKNCLISTQRVCTLALHMAKYCHVMSVENEIVITQMMHNNPMLESQGYKINLIDGEFTQIDHHAEVDLVILNLVERGYEEMQVDDEVMKKFVEKLAECLRISQSVVLILPFDLDPGKFCERVCELRIEPCVEFVVCSNASSSKYVAVLFGKVAKVNLSEIVLNLCGRLSVPVKQQDYIKKIIEELGLSESFRILKEAESEKSSKKENFSKKTQSFFERAKMLGCSFPEIKILYQNAEGPNLVPNLFALKEFFFVYPTEGITTLYVDGEKISGALKILQFIEEQRENELNLNSLLQLIDG